MKFVVWQPNFISIRTSEIILTLLQYPMTLHQGNTDPVLPTLIFTQQEGMVLTLI